MTNILLLTIIALFGLFFIWQIFNYFKSFKQKYFNAGVNTGAAKAIRAIIEKAKEGKSFKIKDDQDEIKLIMVTKNNAKHFSKRS